MPEDNGLREGAEAAKDSPPAETAAAGPGALAEKKKAPDSGRPARRSGRRAAQAARMVRLQECAVNLFGISGDGEDGSRRTGHGHGHSHGI